MSSWRVWVERYVENSCQTSKTMREWPSKVPFTFLSFVLEIELKYNLKIIITCMWSQTMFAQPWNWPAISRYWECKHNLRLCGTYPPAKYHIHTVHTPHSLIPRPFRPSICHLAVLTWVSTASNKCCGKKAWVRGHTPHTYIILEPDPQKNWKRVWEIPGGMYGICND